ncbi:type VI secretion system tube protein TssD [Pseudomonas plecoglossicida]|uniref:Type VI secretion system tube protein Hcp n=1 Tax=Pseudomonas plecoglossicida TaxID=70775 RepID=A0AAD0QV09_PSEDL|nr:type VI secretion system tube protein TssD [Pseudomonas plecoglossicida]AXM95527.1 type VI secretion system tube protein Hcp [Pseudomonas plecoglossicida]EPB94332.1 hcp protein [Pseudomonas plecoglossicida NB2011]QLB56275.1 type VI secretion system tube protein Hcp [Pseudomonas plecoglossicida]GLR37886.1 hypothetical protein GCM10011247_32840 [Pseudomonas plecoglossicida]
MAFPIYMTVTGAAQGQFKGGVEEEGHKEKIRVFEVVSESEVKVHQQTGTAVSQRQHKGVTVVKELDPATPLLIQAFNKGEACEVLLEYMWINKKKGVEEVFYTKKLQGGVISNRQEFLDSGASNEDALSGHMERITFNCKVTTDTWVDGGISTVDDIRNRT